MLQQELNDFIHKHLAKEVEYNAALARQFGFKMPTHYALGFSAESGPVDLAQRKWWMVLKLRLDDFSQDFKIKLPGHDHEDTDLVGDLFRCAGELVGKYIEAHPDIKPDKAESDQVLELMARLGSDDEFHKKAVEVAAGATYTKEKT